MGSDVPKGSGGTTAAAGVYLLHREIKEPGREEENCQPCAGPEAVKPWFPLWLCL